MAYANSFQAPFLFDDGRAILENPHLRRWWPVWAPMQGTTRPLVLWTLAVNYALGGLNPLGYHLVNVAIHLCAALALYGLVRRTLLLPAVPWRDRTHAPAWAAVVAALWALHPLQTESVTYIIQRAESLMGLCYLLALYALLRGATGASGRSWYGLSVLACACGMASKPVMVTAPLIALAYDRIFLAPSWSALWRKRAPVYLGLASTWVILLICVLGAPQDYGTTAGWQVPDITPWRYAATQAGVILHYLRLAFWPHPLVLSYDWPVAGSLQDVLLPGMIVAGLLALTGWALRVRPVLGFLGVWFFGVLAPTSSFLPVIDPVFEHRMYLPLAAVVALAVLGVGAAVRRHPAAARRRWAGWGLSLAAAAALGIMTIRRNAAYAQAVPLWSRVVALQPANARAHGNLGYTYETQGRFDEAVKEYAVVLALSPEDAVAHHNLGTVLVKQGKLPEAAGHLQDALRLRPGYASAHLWLGLVRLMQNQLEPATRHVAAALWLDPANAEVIMERVRSVAQPRGRFDEIVGRLQETFSTQTP